MFVVRRKYIDNQYKDYEYFFFLIDWVGFVELREVIEV